MALRCALEPLLEKSCSAPLDRASEEIGRLSAPLPTLALPPAAIPRPPSAPSSAAGVACPIGPLARTASSSTRPKSASWAGV
jgi:hypothetical protein